jgi:hypothetical protein
MRVFISSVISGMEDFRAAAGRAVRSLGHQVVRAEDFGARPESPQVTCLAGVRDADAVILLIGARYGAVQSSALSATHEEYREARERCPVLVMVESDIERDPEQRQFLKEVQDWAHGHYTASFASADQLLDAVVGALHSLELAGATGPVDSGEMLQRAVEVLPTEARNYSGGRARLAIALTGGPLQTVLRPSQLEAPELRDRLQQTALFGQGAVLTPEQGTSAVIENDALVLMQPDQSVGIAETGTLRLVANVRTPDAGMPVIIEENVRHIIERFLRFADAVLESVDPVHRITHVALAARILDAGDLTWRTRAEHDRSPNSVAMNMFGDQEREAVHLSPPHRTRAALHQNISDLVDDLTVKMRRQFQDRGTQQW